jgi:membrane protein DedA with SNARE-associated domain
MNLLAATFFDRVTDYVSDNPWTYGVVFAVAAIDAFFPLVPSEAVVSAAGTLAAGGDLLVQLVVPVGAGSRSMTRPGRSCGPPTRG